MLLSNVLSALSGGEALLLFPATAWLKILQHEKFSNSNVLFTHPSHLNELKFSQFIILWRYESPTDCQFGLLLCLFVGVEQKICIQTSAVDFCLPDSTCEFLFCHDSACVYTFQSLGKIRRIQEGQGLYQCES